MAITKLIADSLGAGVGGKVLQVVHQQLGSSASTSSTSYVDVLSASITISSGSNILLLSTKSTYGVDGSANIWKGASYGNYLLNGTSIFQTSHVGNRDGSEQLHVSHYSRLLTGLSAGTHTVKLQHSVVNAGSISTDTRTSITLIEVA